MAILRSDGKGNDPMPNDYRLGDKLTVDGVSGGTVDVTAAMLAGVSAIDVVATGGSTNDIDIGHPQHNQELMITVTAKGVGDVTITEDSGVTVLKVDGTAFAAATMDTVGEYVLLRGEVDVWRVIRATAAIS